MREFLMIVEESAYKTPVTTPTIWTTSTAYGLSHYQGLYVRLADGNAFTMRPRPIIVETPYGGGVAIGAYAISDKQECKGHLRVKLCVGQAPLLLSWAGVRLDGAGAPWTSSEPVGDLASCSIYHAVARDDGSLKRRVYRGCKVDAWGLAVSEASTEAMLDLDISGANAEGSSIDGSTDPDATVFPVPACANFPIDPYVFTHLGGSNFVTYQGSVRTQFTELTMHSANVLARRYFPTSHYIALLRFMGRDTTVAIKNLYVTSPDDRAAYEALTTGATSVEMSNSSHGFTINFGANNYMAPFEDDLPLPDLYMQSSTGNNLFDCALGADFTMTFA